MNGAPENRDSPWDGIFTMGTSRYLTVNRKEKKIRLPYQPRTRDENKPDSWMGRAMKAAVGMTCWRLDGASEIHLSPIPHGIARHIRKNGDRRYRISGTRTCGHHDTVTVRTPSLPVKHVPGQGADISREYQPEKPEGDGTTGLCRNGEQ